MKTNFPYGSRTPEQRERYAPGHHQPGNQMWACDNPDCAKFHHYSPFCPNQKDPVMNVTSEIILSTPPTPEQTYPALMKDAVSPMVVLFREERKGTVVHPNGTWKLGQVSEAWTPAYDRGPPWVGPLQWQACSHWHLVMTLSELLTPLQEHFASEAKGYAKQSGIPEGTNPCESTPEMRGCAYSSGAYRIAAHEVKKLIKKHGNLIVSEPTTHES